MSDFPGNDYPNLDNFPLASFQTAIPLPDTEPDEGDLLVVRYNPAWQQALEGALRQLQNPATWQGSDADKIAALNQADLFAWLLTDPVAGVGKIPTPFWDDVTDTDDGYPTETQPWYGYVDDPDLPANELTFVENAAIWAFTGLLAVSGTLAAAILFNTTAPSFVLAMRGGDFAEIIRILVDGEDAVTVETSGDPDELIQVPLAADPAFSTHDILIILKELL
jgi:hypothetical protein